MIPIVRNIRHSLVSKLILVVGLTVLVSFSVWAFFNIRYQRDQLMGQILNGAARMSNTIKLGTHYAMMTNSRDDINQIINNIARQQDIETIRIYNKDGEIKFSNRISEVERTTNIKEEACNICHNADPPLSELDASRRTRFIRSPEGYRQLGIISLIPNEPSCWTDACHVHPKDQTKLGALDVIFSMKETDKDIRRFQEGIIFFAISFFFITSLIIFFSMYRLVKQPIVRLIGETARIATGNYDARVQIRREDEVGKLARAINRMAIDIDRHQTELKKQRNEFQTLFEHVPCEIAVIDRDFRLIGYNQKFADKFNPKKGDFCYHAYKGRDRKCEDCPVELTYRDGKPHFGEETGTHRDGSIAHWIYVTTALRDPRGEIFAAMEMSLDITEMRILEDRLEKSEKKYQAFFNNIPNPVFVLSEDTLTILDCNHSVEPVYGQDRESFIGQPFIALFAPEERDRYEETIRTHATIDRAMQYHQEGRKLFVNIRISPSEYEGQKVFLVTTSDITKRLEAEQQLIQACKMATMGEMATGVAHELNQPLSVIKTASSFFIKKVRRNEPIDTDILCTMSEEIDSHVNRASKIINHMREFGRKTDLELVPVRINDIIDRAFDIFSQQLKVRGIEVAWQLQEDLPEIQGDPSRLEQVFINLLINARDAIEERWELAVKTGGGDGGPDKRIDLISRREGDRVIVEVADTGSGIPPQIADKIFEPFFTTKEVGKGTGLGLSISYGIIQDCGGTITLDTSRAEGTAFVLSFPIPADAGKADGPLVPHCYWEA